MQPQLKGGAYLSFVVIYHMPCPFWNTYKLTQHLLKTGIMVSFNKRYQKHMKDIKSINWIQLISMSILLPNSVSFPFHNHPIKLQWWGIAIARPHASSKQVGHWQLCPWPNPWRQERFKARKVLETGGLLDLSWKKNTMQIWSMRANSYWVIGFNEINKKYCASERKMLKQMGTPNFISFRSTWPL